MLIIVPAQCKVVFNHLKTNTVLIYFISKMNINAAFLFKYLLNTYLGVFEEKQQNF